MPKAPRTSSNKACERELSETPLGDLQELDLKTLLGYQVAQASIVTLRVFDETVGQVHGLRTVDYTVLALIRANQAVSPAQLAKALDLSPSYITLALDRLETRGLVTRATNEADRRGQRLHTTAEGSALALQLTRHLLAAESEAFQTLSPVERLMLAELLHKLACSRRFAEETSRS
jgi:DNA-binding MarR family transcriptional regulator